MRTESLRSQAVGHLVPLAAFGCLVVACDRTMPPNPLEPSPTTVVSLTITGGNAMAEPGTVAHFVATAEFGDGSTSDVTTDATWSAQRQVLTMLGPGTARADFYGTEQLTARYHGVSGTTYIRVAPDGAYLMSGYVHTEGGIPIPDALVELTSSCGTASTMTNAYGRYTLPAEGEATVRVEKAGFDPDSTQMMVDADGPLNFTLHMSEGGGNLRRTYRLDVSASPSCTLPAAVMSRTYTATLEQMGANVWVTLSGADFVAWGEAGFTGTRSGDVVSFKVSTDVLDDFSMVERIPGVGDVYFSGTAAGTFGEPDFSTTFNGRIDVSPSPAGSAKGTCLATNHRMDFILTNGK